MAVLLRQCKRNYMIPAFRGQPPVTACSDEDILFASSFIGHRSRLTACGQLSLPELFAVLDIESAQEAIARCADKDQAARRYDRAAEIERSPLRRFRNVGELRHRP